VHFFDLREPIVTPKDCSVVEDVQDEILEHANIVLSLMFSADTIIKS